MALLQLLQLQKHLAQVALERVGVLAGLAVGLRQKVLAVPGVAQVERVQVVAVAGHVAQLHAQSLERKIFGDAPHAPLAVADSHQFVSVAGASAMVDSRCSGLAGSTGAAARAAKEGDGVGAGSG